MDHPTITHSRPPFQLTSAGAQPGYIKATLWFAPFHQAFHRAQQTHLAALKANARAIPFARGRAAFAANMAFKSASLAHVLVTPPAGRVGMMLALAEFVASSKSVAGLEGLFVSLLTTKSIQQNARVRDAALNAWKNCAGGTKPPTYDAGGFDFAIDIDGSTSLISSMDGIYGSIGKAGDAGDLGAVLTGYGISLPGMGNGAGPNMGGLDTPNSDGPGLKIGGVAVGLPGSDPNQSVGDAMSSSACSIAGGLVGVVAGDVTPGPEWAAAAVRIGVGGVVTGLCVAATETPDPLPAQAGEVSYAGVVEGEKQGTEAGAKAGGTQPAPDQSHEDPGGPDGNDTGFDTRTFLVGTLKQLGITPSPHSCSLAGVPQFRPDGSFQPGCMDEFFETHPSAAAAYGVAARAKSSHGGRQVTLPGEVDNSAGNVGTNVLGGLGKTTIPGGGVNVVTPPKPET